jgi:hypothetical protein
METLELISAAWPIFIGFIGLVIVLAKMHAEIDTLKEKVKMLFTLWNGKDGE